MGKIIPKKANNVASRVNANKTVSIVKLDEDDFFYLVDGLAAEAWNMMDGRRDLAGILSRLEKKHKVSASVLKKELTKLITQLQKAKLLEKSN